MNYENDLSWQLANTLNQYKDDVNAFVLKLLGNYATTTASYVADMFSMVLRDKYCALWQLSRNEVIHRAVTECRKNEYERAQKYLNDFMDLHGVFQSIVIRNNFMQNILSITKDDYAVSSIKGNHSAPCLITAPNSRFIKDSGCISTFYFELRDRRGKIGTLEAGISTHMLSDAFHTAKERIPYLKAMCLTDGTGQILYPESFARKNTLQREIMEKIGENPSGCHVSFREVPVVTGYASMAALPFTVTSRWILVCEFRTSDIGKTETTK